VDRSSAPHKPYVTEHRAAVNDFIRAAGQLDTATWLRPLGPDRWSPALITEHVTLSIEAATDDAAGRAHMVLRLNAWRRFVARTIYLSRLLKTGVFPPGIRSPRETRPSATPHTQAESLENLKRALAIFETTLAAHPAPARCRLTHPYFGSLPLITGLRLLTLHAQHHQAQLPRRSAGESGPQGAPA